MKSIRRQLTFSLLAGFGLLLATGSTALYLGTRGMLFHDFDAVLLARARALASLTENDHGAVELHLDDELMPEYGRKQHEAFFQLWLADGRVIKRSESLAGADLPRIPSTTLEAPRYWNIPLPSGAAGRAVSFTYHPFTEDRRPGGPTAPLTVVVARDRTQLDAHLRVFATGAATTSALMMIGAALVAAYSVRQSLRSLAELGRQVTAIDESSLSSRFDCGHLPAELTPICQRLNDLLSRLDVAFVRERRFSDDAAHELRTPVAELRALAELSLTSGTADTEALGAYQDALAIAQQMEEIVNGLLAIARYESGREPIGREPVPLRPLLDDLWRPHAARALERSLQVVCNVPSDLTMLTDRALLRVVVSNLFSNAADHSPTGAEVLITAKVDDALVRLAISNPAGPLAAGDLPLLFERFWRKDTARTSSSHAGLGLSIAQAAARLLDTELHAEVTVAGMFTVSLTLPAELGTSSKNES